VTLVAAGPHSVTGALRRKHALSNVEGAAA
jgi:hypothetical protein